MRIQGAFEPQISPPEPRQTYCGHCGGDLYEGDAAYLLGDSPAPVCEQCLDDYFNDLSRSEKAALVGAIEVIVSFDHGGAYELD